MKISCVGIILLYLNLSSFAQYNDTVHYYIGAMSTGTINKTNASASYVLSNLLRMGIRKKDFGFNCTNSWLYGEQQKRLTNNDYFTTLDFNLYKTLPHFYYWGLGNYTTGYSLKINNQYQAGAGIAYNILDTGAKYLNISDGVLYESSDVLLHDTARDVYHTLRNSLRLSFRFKIKDVIVINGTGFLQNSLSNKDDYIVKSNVGLTFRVSSWLAFSTLFSYNRFNRTGKENTLFSYGLSLDRYF